MGWLSVLMCTVLVVGALTAYANYRQLAGNIDQRNVHDDLGNQRPEKVSQAQNILLIGSDTRSAQGTGKYGEATGARADTVILLHLPPERDTALAVSFPRDSWVQIPPCRTDTGMSRPQTGRLNKAFHTGGPGCTWKTIESLTGIHIDHFVMVNFHGFKKVVNALGGVRVCLPTPVNDPDSNLELAAGPQRVKGEQALGFVRLRHYGNGSDLERIDRQQRFLAGMVKQATNMELLLNPGKLLDFLNTATSAVTTDNRLGLDGLQQLALSARNISPDDVSFVTVPVAGRGDGATVEWKQPEAARLFRAIKHDRKQAANAGKGSEQQKPDKPNKPTLPPGQVKVRVLNGTEIQGLASDTSAKLESAGFKVVKVGNAESQGRSATVVRHDPERKRHANTLAASLPQVKQQVDESEGEALSLVLGPDAEGAEVTTPPPSGSSKVPQGVDRLKGSDNPCPN